MFTMQEEVTYKFSDWMAACDFETIEKAKGHEVKIAYYGPGDYRVRVIEKSLFQ